MKSLKENEMIEAIKEAEKNGKLDKFSIAGNMAESFHVRTFGCTIVDYNEDEILVKSVCFMGEVKFKKSKDDNRFYYMEKEKGAFWALCLDTKESSDIAKTYSETNEFYRSLCARMKLLTEEELQPIAAYLEGCFERRFGNEQD